MQDILGRNPFLAILVVYAICISITGTLYGQVKKITGTIKPATSNVGTTFELDSDSPDLRIHVSTGVSLELVIKNADWETEYTVYSEAEVLSLGRPEIFGDKLETVKFDDFQSILATIFSANPQPVAVANSDIPGSIPLGLVSLTEPEIQQMLSRLTEIGSAFTKLENEYVDQWNKADQRWTDSPTDYKNHIGRIVHLQNLVAIHNQLQIEIIKAINSAVNKIPPNEKGLNNYFKDVQKYIDNQNATTDTADSLKVRLVKAQNAHASFLNEVATKIELLKHRIHRFNAESTFNTISRFIGRELTIDLPPHETDKIVTVRIYAKKKPIKLSLSSTRESLEISGIDELPYLKLEAENLENLNPIQIAESAPEGVDNGSSLLGSFSYEVRKRHHFRLAGGFVSIWRQQSEYSLHARSEATVLEDGSTEMTTWNKIVEVQRSSRILPTANLIIYPKGKDLHASAYQGLQRWIPGLMIGFVPTEPSDHFLIGFNFEPKAGFDINLGYARTRVQRLLPDFEVGNLIDLNTALPVVEEIDHGFFGGISLDTSVLNTFLDSIVN